MYARLFFLTLRTVTIFPKFESVNMKTGECAHASTQRADRQIDTVTKILCGHFPLSEILRGI
jgi:hypothetical protein